MKASVATKTRNTRPAPGAGKLYSVGCLPLLIAWLLLDLIGRTILWGIFALFDKDLPVWSTAVQGTAYAILIPLGVIFTATLIWMLYLHISDCISNFFRKDKKGKKIENQEKKVVEKPGRDGVPPPSATGDGTPVT